MAITGGNPPANSPEPCRASVVPPFTEPLEGENAWPRICGAWLAHGPKPWWTFSHGPFNTSYKYWSNPMYRLYNPHRNHQLKPIKGHQFVAEMIMTLHSAAPFFGFWAISIQQWDLMCSNASKNVFVHLIYLASTCKYRAPVKMCVYHHL